MSDASTRDLTIIYSSAHKIPERFANYILEQVYKCGYPVKELHCTPQESSITNYYRSLLEAAKAIDTPYLGFAEDDTLYPDEHFNHRSDTFAFNMTRWNLFTWSKPPFFSLCQRKILGTLIAPRQKFIEVMEQRITLPEKQMVEPGRAEPSEDFLTYNPVVVICHPDSFGYDFQGTKKKAGKIRALSLPYWGEAERIRKLYEL